MIPGSNLLSMAFGLIAPTPVRYRKYVSRTTNSQGNYVSQFEELPEPIGAQVQRVKRDQYIEMGLEFQRNYVTIYACFNMVDLDRDISGDQFVYGGRAYQLENQGSWFNQDGWANCLAVDIGRPVYDESGAWTGVEKGDSKR